jgi:hypothetical protein
MPERDKDMTGKEKDKIWVMGSRTGRFVTCDWNCVWFLFVFFFFCFLHFFFICLFFLFEVFHLIISIFMD